jgi:hypothetical protein
MKMGEKGFDFWNAYVLGVAFVVEKDKAANLLYVGLFCSASRLVGVMLEATFTNFLGRGDGISITNRARKLISSLRFYNATLEKSIRCYTKENVSTYSSFLGALGWISSV